MKLRPRLHGSGRIWDRSEIRPFSPVYTRIRPVRGSQIRPVPWFLCVYTAEFNLGVVKKISHFRWVRGGEKNQSFSARLYFMPVHLLFWQLALSNWESCKYLRKEKNPSTIHGLYRNV